MFSSLNLDDALREIRERHAWAEHEALVRHAAATRASSSTPAAVRSSVAPATPAFAPLRNRAAGALRDLACRLDPAICLDWT
jgi:hypothetical protein